jgi:hypothetical protein
VPSFWCPSPNDRHPDVGGWMHAADAASTKVDGPQVFTQGDARWVRNDWREWTV